jgi:hypothetical protein
MRFRLRAALLAVLLAAAGGCNGRSGLLGPQYEYEEDLTLSLDGSATLVVNASIPALVGLRGLALDTDPRARQDRVTNQVRELYKSPYAEVVRVGKWTRQGRKFVGVRLRIPDIRNLPKASPFSWESYDLRQEDGQHVFKQVVRAAAAKPAALGDLGLTGNEIVAFRLHLPSHIRHHNARDIETGAGRSVQRGNILTWEQRLSDRAQGTPLEIEVRMDSESILYRTLYLFGIAFLSAIVVLGLLIWWTVRKGRKAEERSAASPVPSGPGSSSPHQ